MDTTPLTARIAISSDTLAKPTITPSPLGSEATQTAQAVQAIEQTASAGHSGAEVKQAKEQPLSEQQLAEMAEQMESFVGTFNRGLEFKVDEDSGRNVVKVIDRHSGDTIRQIPTEELLDVIARLAEASGGIIDVKA